MVNFGVGILTKVRHYAREMYSLHLPRCNYFEILSSVVSPCDASAGLERVVLLNVAFSSSHEPCNFRLGEL